MIRIRFLVPTLLTCLLAMSGCTSIDDPGCTSDDECRGERVCSEIGICMGPERAVIDRDSGNPDVEEDVEEDDVPNPDVDPIQLRSARVYDDCDDDQHVTRISLSPEPFPACDGIVAARIDIRIDDALDLNQQSPGEVTFERGDSVGIQVQGCEGAFCTNASEGRILLEFYEPGEMLNGTYEMRLQPSDEVSDTIAGQRFEGSFQELDVNWCSFADDECRQ